MRTYASWYLKILNLARVLSSIFVFASSEDFGQTVRMCSSAGPSLFPYVISNTLSNALTRVLEINH